VIDTLLTGESGETAMIVYGDGVKMVKSFDAGDIQSALKNLVADAAKARMIDAGLRAISLLREQPAAHGGHGWNRAPFPQEEGIGRGDRDRRS
jgi:hypothetical protein